MSILQNLKHFNFTLFIKQSKSQTKLRNQPTPKQTSKNPKLQQMPNKKDNFQKVPTNWRLFCVCIRRNNNKLTSMLSEQNPTCPFAGLFRTSKKRGQTSAKTTKGIESQIFSRQKVKVQGFAFQILCRFLVVKQKRSTLLKSFFCISRHCDEFGQRTNGRVENGEFLENCYSKILNELV